MPNFHSYDADAYCVRCGKEIYFEVGPGLSLCPHCDGNYEKTDEELAIEEQRQKKADIEAEVHEETIKMKLMYLQELKRVRPAKEVNLIDSIMDDICAFQADSIRNQYPI